MSYESAIVNLAYAKLSESEDNTKDLVDGILGASETLERTIEELLRIASYDYAEVLGYEPSARKMVDLVGHSYSTYVHPQTGIHPEVYLPFDGPEFSLGQMYEIQVFDNLDRIVLINPSQYHQIEKQYRASGKIKDQKIHCPFAMHSKHTEPFVPAKTLGPNPLQHTLRH